MDRHAKHPDLVQDACRIKFTGVIGSWPQAEHVSFATKHRQCVQLTGDSPGRTALVAPACIEIPPSIAFRQINLNLLAWLHRRSHQYGWAEHVLRIPALSLGIPWERERHGALHWQAGTSGIFNRTKYVRNQAIAPLQPRLHMRARCLVKCGRQ